MARTRCFVLAVWLILTCAVSVFGKPIELQFWGPLSGPDGQKMLELIEVFNKEHPDIKATFTIVTWAEYYDKLLVAIAGGTAPQVALIHPENVTALAVSGALQDLTPSLAKLGYTRSLFVPDLWDLANVGGKQYAIPQAWQPRLVAYNRDLMAEAGLPDAPPITGDQYIEYGKRMTIDRNADGKPEQWGAGIPGAGGQNLWRVWMSLLWQYGGELLSANNTKVAFNDTTGVEALDLMVRLTIEHNFLGVQGSRDLFNQNKVGMRIAQPSELPSHTAAGVNFDTGPFPRFGKQDAVWYVGGMYGLPTGGAVTAAQLEASLTLIRWLADHGLDFTEGGIPAYLPLLRRSDFMKRAALLSRPALQAPYARTSPGLEKMWDIYQVFATHIDAAMRGRVAPKSAIDAMAAETQAILDSGK